MGRIVEMPLPRLGETMEEGRIGLIIKKPGERFRRGETLLEVESDKTTVEVPALQDGILVEWLVVSDDMVPVESAIARIEIEGEAVAEVRVAAPVPDPSSRRKPGSITAVSGGPGVRRDEEHFRQRASTAARAAARRKGVDLSAVQGTGRNGRITRLDLEAAARPARATYHVETPQGKIFFREWPALGAAKGNVLLLHGLFADSQSYTTLGRKIAAKGYRTYALDLPGHGETLSNAASVDGIVTAVAASLPPVKFHIVGHSFGAIIAARFLDRALSLTLLSPAGCGEEINGEFVDAMLGGHIDHAIGFLGETVPPEAQASLADHLGVHGSQLRAIASGVTESGGQTVSILGALVKAKVPVQAVFMRDDRIIPAQHALNLPFNVATRILPGASHLPHWRDPDAIAKLIS
jgi:pyruvate dehydrogenase E2 component (dihydrolipoamide acetyltransferase)